MTKKRSNGRFLRGQKWERFSIDDRQADFYVAPDGDDSWSGTLPSPNTNQNDGPFATISQAQKAVRILKRQIYSKKKLPTESRFVGSDHEFGEGKDILVLIRGGNYFLDKPLRFGPDDGGERIETDLPTGAFEFHKLKDHFVTYAAFPNETPIISGGRKITSWQQDGEKWIVDVKGIEVKKVVVNGKKQTLARTPNEGYFTPSEMPRSTTEFKFDQGDLEEWSGMSDNRIVMLLRWHIPVNSITKIDTENRVAYLAKPEPGIVIVPPRYYVENVEQLLDSPGEWFFNSKTEKLSYIPDQDIKDPNSADVTVPILSQLMIVSGDREKSVRNLRFYGLTFQDTIAGGHAVSFNYSANCELIDSEIKGISNVALYLGNGCYLNKIIGNTIRDADGGGIMIAGNPHPQWADLIHGTIIAGNRVSECGEKSVFVENARDTTISHNEITNTRGRTPLYLGGWSNAEIAIDGGYRVEYNHIHHVQVGSDDSGAITTAGMTANSVIRRNLIHDVSPGFFNENVAFWFNNLSSGWTATENIYYNLEQAEMKLCAALISDNIYQDNFLIETPKIDPEIIIDGDAKFKFDNLVIDRSEINTGKIAKISADVTNIGSTGIAEIDLYVDGKVVESKKFPVVRNNTRRIIFDFRFYDAGIYSVAIGDTSPLPIRVNGDAIQFLCSELEISAPAIPLGDELVVTAEIENVRGHKNSADVDLRVGGEIVNSKQIGLAPKEIAIVSFRTKPKIGDHEISIGDATPMIAKVYPHRTVKITECDFKTHSSGTAGKCEFEIDPKNNRYAIKAGGTDFLHAEDSYGAIYLKNMIRGNFVATLKVIEFEKPVNPWYRVGIFVRNDISKSHETDQGSLGSVLMYATPKLSGIQWDEFGDGCMHKSSVRQIHEGKDPFPIWLKLARHGDTFTGYTSYDGQNWEFPKRVVNVPHLAEIMDIGIAAGTIDQKPTLVMIEDFTLKLEN